MFIRLSTDVYQSSLFVGDNNIRKWAKILSNSIMRRALFDLFLFFLKISLNFTPIDLQAVQNQVLLS